MISFKEFLQLLNESAVTVHSETEKPKGWHPTFTKYYHDDASKSQKNFYGYRKRLAKRRFKQKVYDYNRKHIKEPYRQSYNWRGLRRPPTWAWNSDHHPHRRTRVRVTK